MRTILALACLLMAIPAHAGLDIAAYEGLTLVQTPTKGSNAESAEQLQKKNQVMFSLGEPPHRHANLQIDKVYRYAKLFEFRAGSYSSYNFWRNELAKLGGYTQFPAEPRRVTKTGVTDYRYTEGAWRAKGGPFWELLNFSDGEGVIGPQACKRISADFERFHGQAKVHENEYFRTSYEDWRKAFAMCAKNGAVVFQ